MKTCQIINGDCLTELRKLPAESVQCCVTSPPYWGLRDYGVDGQLGLEKTPEEYVAKLAEILHEVRRVLKDDGVLWLNLGDSYAGGGNYRGINSANTLTSKQGSNRGSRGLSQQLGALGKDTGLAAKNLIGIPWRVAFALQADGWWLRQDIIWAKPNPMPESVKDRCTKAHEYVFLLSKAASYYYDAAAIAEQTEHIQGPRPFGGAGNGKQNKDRHDYEYAGDDGTRNRRSVWTITPKPYKEAHFATFPPEIPRLCISAGSRSGDTILDPFGGSGTTGEAAQELGRNAILIEINRAYCEMARARTAQTGMILTG